MSPAYSLDPDEVFTWIGVIMYLPSELSDAKKEQVKNNFRVYSKLVQQLCDEYGAVPHWAKLELLTDDKEYNDRVRHQLHKRYDLELYGSVRSLCDPHGILMNNVTSAILED